MREWPTQPPDGTAKTDPDPDRLLPDLEPGVVLLDIAADKRDDRRAHDAPIVHGLVIDHLLRTEGTAYWVDAGDHATTGAFARLAPSQGLLDRVHVARGFTPYKHYAALCAVPAAAERHAAEPALLVAPAVDAPYRAANALDDTDARTLTARALARLAGYARAADIAVLVTRTATGDDGPVAAAADRRLRCVRTPFGPRFGGAAETLCYPVEGGVQTTFAYWRRLLDTRAKRAGVDTPTGPMARPNLGADPADGASRPSPLREAWAAADGDRDRGVR
jgi:hypothetical protein